MTFTEYFETIATEFIQNVVVIDDQAFGGTAATEEVVHEELEALHAAEEEADSETVPTTIAAEDVTVPDEGAFVEKDAEVGQDLNAREVVDEFASRSVFCSVIVPTKGESTTAVAMAGRADITVVDWLIHRDQVTALQIISGIVTSDRDRVRLIVLYTGEAEREQLKKAIDEVEGELRKNQDLKLERKDDFTLSGPGLRVTIYGKRHSTGPVRGFPERLKSWRELPNQAIKDFADLCKGLVPAVALKALSTVRSKSWTLLSAYSASLDPAYLWHRACLDHPNEAETQLLAMIVADIESILVDAQTGDVANVSAIKDWLVENGAPWKDRFDIKGAGAYGDTDVLALLTTGAAKNTGQSNALVNALDIPNARKSQPPFFKRSAAFAGSFNDMELVNARYAERSSVKAICSAIAPRLHLGTIVAFEPAQAAASYFVCLQPLCDGERIAVNRDYPMLPLTSVPVGDGKFNFVVFDGASELRLKVEPAAFNIVMFSFAADGTTSTVVAEENAGTYRFQTTDGKEYRWLADLKAAHAQRLAQQLANNLSRVGLDEAEWLRLKAK